MDRHYTLENYAEMKARLFVKQRGGDFAVLNADDPICRGYADRGEAKAVWFSSTQAVSPGAYLDGGRILLNGEALMDAAEVPLRGVHNLENTMAAAAIANLAGATHAQIRAAVMTFPGVEHRLEFVRDLGGVAWYNDSKATNVDATLKAIAAFPGRRVDHSRRQGQEQRLYAADRTPEGKSAGGAADRRGGGQDRTAIERRDSDFAMRDDRGRCEGSP